MRVENPKFGEDGQIEGCHTCPLDQGSNDSLCRKWWYRDGETDALLCPTKETLPAACLMAEEAAKGGKG